MSVVHFAVKKSPGYSQPIKSKVQYNTMIAVHLQLLLYIGEVSVSLWCEEVLSCSYILRAHSRRQTQGNYALS